MTMKVNTEFGDLECTDLIHFSIYKIMGDIEYLAKNRKNSQQGYAFRGVDDVYNAFHPLLAKYGVFTTTKVIAESSSVVETKNGGKMVLRVLTVSVMFHALDGSFVECVMLGEAADSGDKAAGKAMSYAHKYAFFQVFALPTDEPKDTENDSPDLLHKSVQHTVENARQNLAKILKEPSLTEMEVTGYTERAKTFDKSAPDYAEELVELAAEIAAEIYPRTHPGKPAFQSNGGRP